MKPAKELTREEIASALAEAQGWVDGFYPDIERTAWLRDKWNSDWVCKDNYSPHTDDTQYNTLTLNPEIHAGMIDVLDEWFYKTDGIRTLAEWWHNPEYLQDIRLWQLRAVVEYLRRRQEK